MPSRAEGAATATEACILGLLQGPTELLPVSSSAHIALATWLVGGRLRRTGADEKAFEVALHAGSAAALLIVLRDDIAAALPWRSGRRACVLAVASIPPALAGLALERPVEERLGTPMSTAAGLALGAVALGLADLAPPRRSHLEASVADGLWLGLAQACALVPGVSRAGASLAVARGLGFARADAARLSRETAVPVVAGASALKALRLVQRGASADIATSLGVGALAAFASTLACRGLVARLERSTTLLPFAAYRLVLAGSIVWTARHRDSEMTDRSLRDGSTVSVTDNMDRQR